ncbi:MAG: hypothetical protein PHH54_01425 [Candidatus Nanoarchaeia archaeon]|nr:hypothetical protein [Candidatus Nanoarchaeia archaeon]MDD5740624.1 hypothetical protein [Candidatus Nanoarchaeia archaeon]
MEGESSTSLDALYDILREKKIMRVEDIAAHFNVSKELVMEWGKILEAGELATINNPRIGKPTIKIAGYSGEESKQEQKKELSEADKIKKELENKENLAGMNKIVKNRNQGKINEAKKIISESRKRGYDNEFIKNMFSEKGWPPKLIEELLS